MSIIKHEEIISPGTNDTVEALKQQLIAINTLLGRMSDDTDKNLKIVDPSDSKAVNQLIKDVQGLEAAQKKQKKLYEEVQKISATGLEAQRRNAKALVEVNKAQKKQIASSFKDNIKGISEQNKELKKLNDRYRDLEKNSVSAAQAQKKANDGVFKEYIQSLTAQNSGIKNLNEQLREQEKLSRKTKSRSGSSVDARIAETERKIAEAESDRGKQLAKLNEKLKEKRKLNAQEAKDALGITGAYAQLSRRLTELRKKYKDHVASGNKSTKATRKLKREIQALDARLKAVDASVGQFGRSVGNYEKSLSSARNAFKSLASAAGIAFGAFGAYRVIENAITVLRNYETQLISVGKTTDIQGAQLKALGQSFRDLTTGQLRGIKLDALLELAETAGQLGVTGADNILKFSETLARLEKSTDLAGQEGAQAIARILNVTNEGVDTVDRFGSVIVALGNSFAATEKEIVANTTEIARGTAVYGVSASEAAALGTATRALGVQSEVAGSALQRTFEKIDSSVRAGGEGFEALQEITGRTAEQLRSDYGESSTRVFQQFINGLGRIKDEGGSVTEALKALQLNTVRYGKVLTPLAGRADELNRALTTQNVEYKKNTALLVESERALNSLDSEIIGVTEAWKDYVLSQDEAVGASTVLRETVGFIADNIKALIDTIFVAVAAYVSWRLAIVAFALIGRAHTFLLAQMEGATLGLNRATLKAAVSMRSLKAAFASTGFGLLIIAITELIFNFDNLKDLLSGTTAEARKFRKETNDLADSQVGLLSELLRLNKGTEKYELLLRKINQEHPQLLDNLALQRDGYQEISDTIQEINDKRLQDLATSDNREQLRLLKEDLKEVNDELADELASIYETALDAGVPRDQAKKLISSGFNEELLKIAANSKDAADFISKLQDAGIDLSSLGTAVKTRFSNVLIDLGLDAKSLSIDIDDVTKSLNKTKEAFKDLAKVAGSYGDEDGFNLPPGVRSPFSDPSPLLPKDVGKGAEKAITSINDLKKAIADLKDEKANKIDAYNAVDLAEIQARIDAKQAELDRILGKDGKGGKGRDIQTAIEKLRIDALKRAISLNKELADDENASLADRVNAVRRIERLENRILDIRNDQIDRADITDIEKDLQREALKDKYSENEKDRQEKTDEIKEYYAKLDRERQKISLEIEKKILGDSIFFKDKRLKKLKDDLKGATGAERTAILNEIDTIIEAKRYLELEKALLEFEIAKLSLDPDDPLYDEKLDSFRQDFRSKEKRIDVNAGNISTEIEGAFDTDPLERFERIANRVFDGLLDRATALQQKNVEIAEKRIQDTERAISFQEARAAQGLDNQLGYEKKKLLQREKDLIEQQKRLERAEKVKAFYSLLRSNSSKNDNTGQALADTILEFGLAEAFARGFKTGGYTGDMGVDQIAGVTHGGEFVIDAPWTKKLNLRGASMSDFKQKITSGDMSDFGTNQIRKERGAIEKSVPVSNHFEIVNELKSVRDAIESQETSNWDFDGFSKGMLQMTETIHRRGVTIRNKHKSKL